MAADKGANNAMLVAMDVGDYRRAKALAARVEPGSDTAALAARVKEATAIDGRALLAFGFIIIVVLGFVLQAMAH